MNSLQWGFRVGFVRRLDQKERCQLAQRLESLNEAFRITNTRLSNVSIHYETRPTFCKSRTPPPHPTC